MPEQPPSSLPGGGVPPPPGYQPLPPGYPPSQYQPPIHPWGGRPAWTPPPPPPANGKKVAVIVASAVGGCCLLLVVALILAPFIFGVILGIQNTDVNMTVNQDNNPVFSNVFNDLNVVRFNR